MPRPRKRFAQHWLRSDAILAKIIAAADLVTEDRVLEIGPGTGVLTRKLLPLVQSVVAIEIDRDLYQALTKQFAHIAHVHLIEGDFLTIDLASALASAPMPPLPEHPPGYPNKVVANIPYNITGPILEKLLGRIANPNPHPFTAIVLLMQKEVAERLCARPGTRAFGALSVRVQYLADCQWVCNVPARAFQPPPQVDSAVVKLTPRPFQPSATNPRQLEMLVKLGFATKRKMLRNNIQCFIERDQLSAILEDLNLNSQVRAENLSVEQWVALSNRIDHL